LNLI
jgi:hypothetical protein